MKKDNTDAAERFGKRMRKIRKETGMNQIQLGEKIGLKADRIRKYENGIALPMPKLIKKIAEALNVSEQALTDPTTDNCVGAVFACFELEEQCNLIMSKTNDSINIQFENDILNKYLLEWYYIKKEYEEKILKTDDEEVKKTLHKEYQFLKWNFPESFNEKNKKKRKEQLEQQIEELQQELAELENDNDKEQ